MKLQRLMLLILVVFSFSVQSFGQKEGRYYDPDQPQFLYHLHIRRAYGSDINAVWLELGPGPEDIIWLGESQKEVVQKLREAGYNYGEFFWEKSIELYYWKIDVGFLRGKLAHIGLYYYPTRYLYYLVARVFLDFFKRNGGQVKIEPSDVSSPATSWTGRIDTGYTLVLGDCDFIGICVNVW